MQPGTQGTEDMATVQLRDRKQIERSHKQTNPGGAADGRQQKGAGGDPRMIDGVEEADDQWRAKDQVPVSRISKAGNEFGMQHPVNECGEGENETHQRAGSADVEERAGRSNRGANEDEGAECAIDVGEGNEERITRTDVMITASEEVAEFVGEKNGEQGEGERQAGSEARGVLVEQSESTHQFVEGCGFSVGVSDRELPASGEAGAKSKEEQDAREDQRLYRRPVGNRCIAR